MTRSRCALFAVVLAALAPACSEPYAQPPTEDCHWHGDPRPAVRRWGLVQREYVALVLPEVRHARPDHPGRIHPLTANVLSTGILFFKGHEWRLGAVDEAERKAALGAFAEELAECTSGANLRAEDGTSRVPYLLHAGRAAGWADVRAVLLAGVRPADVRLRLLQWAVEYPASAPHEDSVQVARIDLTEGGASPRDLPEIRLSIADDAVSVSVEGRSFSFGPQPDKPFSDATFVARANVIWTEVEAHLDAIDEGTGGAVLRMKGDTKRLPWGFVVKVLDLLYGAGLRDVWLPDEKLRLELGAPPPDVVAIDRGKDQPVIAPIVVIACALAVLLAFAVTLLPRRR